jgi:PIN domain nuclease of toxin-antitoxin system
LKLLADTEAVIRFAIDDLPTAARDAMADPDNTVHISAASVWEIATKVRIGKLTMPDNALAKGLARWIIGEGFDLLSITAEHADLAGSMTIDHRDPWDRMILAQARLEDLVVVGGDPVFRHLGSGAIWR